LKVSITGHTSGIGKHLYESLDNTIGFSRSNGFDIENENNLDKIYELSKDCHVFINNAYFQDAQLKLFNKFYKNWRYKEKTIINIVSKTIYSKLNDEYTLFKKELSQNVIQSTDKGGYKVCRVINVNPGYVKTNMTKEFHTKQKMLEVSEITDIVKWVLNLPHHIQIGELGVWVTDIRRETTLL
jgi:hypothetical protein